MKTLREKIVEGKVLVLVKDGTRVVCGVCVGLSVGMTVAWVG